VLLGDGNLRNVPGIARREEDGTPLLNPPCRLVPKEELHRYTVYEMDQALGPGQTTMNLEGGRGCPFHCSFCSTSRFWNRHFRMKPAEDLIREMDTFHERSGIRRFSIEHDMFTANRKYVETFCRLLTDRGTPYRWACSSRIDVLDEDLIQLMARAGCEEVFLGIETGNTVRIG